jgi:hypothetical protein
MEGFRPTFAVNPAKKGRPSAVSDVLGSIDKLGINQRLKEYRIFNAWAEAVGKAIARKTMPRRLMGTKLYVNVSSQTWMTELMYQKTAIMEKIAEIIGPDSVTEIVFSPGPVSVKSEGARERASVKRVRISLTDEQKRFIEAETAKIPEGGLKRLVEKLMEESLRGG